MGASVESTVDIAWEANGSVGAASALMLAIKLGCNRAAKLLLERGTSPAVRPPFISPRLSRTSK